MFLFQNSDRTAFVLDAEGRTFRIEPNIPWEVKPQISSDCDKGGYPVQNIVPADKVAQQICDDGKFYGIVIIPEIQEGFNTKRDVETARARSTEVRRNAENALVDQYVSHQKQNQLAVRPVAPPSESIQAILNGRGLDLKRDFGLEPVGYRVSEAAAARDALIETQGREIKELKEMLAMLMEDKKAKKVPQNA